MDPKTVLVRAELDRHNAGHVSPRATALRQDRITSDGRFVSSVLPPSAGAQQQAPIAGVPRTAPKVPPISEAALEALSDFIQVNRNVVVLTGAGASTESSIPDYRGPQGAYSTGFKPMTHQQFMASAKARARYWARSFAGWHEFSSVQPNATHEALARLQQHGWLGQLLTQNVDRLHHKAGSRDVIELHGTTHRVICMQCGEVTEREPFQRELAALNPGVARAVALMPKAGEKARFEQTSVADETQPSALGVSPGGAKRSVRRPDGDVELPDGVLRRPDGDVELTDEVQSGFIVPPCPSCGGILKPNVVFFGDGLPKERAARAMQAVQECDGLLVVGSSLMVYSAFRLARAATGAGAQLALLTVGPTRADDLPCLKVEALAGEATARLAAHPALQIPRW